MDTPTTVSNISSAMFIISTWIFQRIAHLAVVSMMLERCSEVVLVKQRDPVFLSFSLYFQRIGSFIQVRTRRKQWIVIVSEFVEAWMFAYWLLHPRDLLSKCWYISRIHHKVNSRANNMMMVRSPFKDLRNSFSILRVMLRIEQQEQRCIFIGISDINWCKGIVTNIVISNSQNHWNYPL